ncbi:hypothetical protein AB5J62_26190 [Amycolatopsis sp. cg5]|uniref:hypothetical protein n=1 Tax=Amycolatopsis sp. cg5 TaxID=3238802 RepID=UPI0035268A33
MPDLGGQFDALRQRGWTLCCFGVGKDFTGLGALIERGSYTDVLVVRNPESASAFGAMRVENGSPFLPDFVCWSLHGQAESIMIAALNIPDESKARPVFVRDKLCAIPASWPEPHILKPEDQI